MKNYTFGSCASALVLAAGIFASTFQASGQSVLIKIYTWNPSEVRFVATVSNAAANATVSIANGIDLIKFFTNNSPALGAIGGAVTGNLIPAGAGTAFNAWETDNLLALGQNVDLNLFNNVSSANEVFTTSTAAVNNNQMARINLSSLVSYLPTIGTTGNIYSGDINSTGNNWLIGKWIVVVPEPSVQAQMALGAMVLAGLAFVRRTRRASANR